MASVESVYLDLGVVHDKIKCYICQEETNKMNNQNKDWSPIKTLLFQLGVAIIITVAILSNF